AAGAAATAAATVRRARGHDGAGALVPGDVAGGARIGARARAAVAVDAGGAHADVAGQARLALLAHHAGAHVVVDAAVERQRQVGAAAGEVDGRRRGGRDAATGHGSDGDGERVAGLVVVEVELDGSPCVADSVRIAAGDGGATVERGGDEHAVGAGGGA